MEYKVDSELDLQDWAVIGSKEVLSERRSYTGASAYADFCYSEGVSGVAIVAQVVADRMRQNKLNRENDNAT